MSDANSAPPIPRLPRVPWLGICGPAARLFRDHPPRRGRRCAGGRRRNGECEPSVPAIGTVLRGEFLVAFDVNVALPFFADWEQISELWPNANNLRLEAAHPVAGATIATNFFVNIAHDADRKLLRQKLRRGPIKVPVNTVLIIGTRVSEIISKPGHCGKFVTGFRIEIRVAKAAIDRAMTDAEIGKPRRVIGTDRNVTGRIHHEIVDASVPFQLRYRVEIAPTGHRVGDAVRTDEAKRRQRRRESPRQ